MAELRGRALIAWLIVCIVWGSTYLAIRVGVTELPPFYFAGSRFIVAGLVLGAVGMARGARFTGDPRPLIGATILGAFFLLGGNGGVVWAEQFVPSGLASVYVVSVTIWAAVFDALIPGGTSRITPRIVIGLVVGFLASLMLVGVTPAELLAADWRGPLALTAASASWAVGSVYAKRRPVKLPLMLSSSVQMVSGGLMLLLLGAFTREAIPAAISREAALSWLYLVLFGSIIAFTAFNYALKHASATVVGTYAYVNPVVAVLLGWMFLREPITPRTVLAMLLMLGSVALIQFGGQAKSLFVMAVGRSGGQAGNDGRTGGRAA